MKINLGTCHSSVYWPDGAKVFIDWNIDGDFDDNGETVTTIALAQSPTSNNISFTVTTIVSFCHCVVTTSNIARPFSPVILVPFHYHALIWSRHPDSLRSCVSLVRYTERNSSKPSQESNQ